MTRKHFIELADIVADTLAAASVEYGEDARTVVYDALYRPVVTMAADSNRFSQLRFAEYVGTRELERVTLRRAALVGRAS